MRCASLAAAGAPKESDRAKQKSRTRTCSSVVVLLLLPVEGGKSSAGGMVPRSGNEAAARVQHTPWWPLVAALGDTYHHCRQFVANRVALYTLHCASELLETNSLISKCTSQPMNYVVQAFSVPIGMYVIR